MKARAITLMLLFIGVVVVSSSSGAAAVGTSLWTSEEAQIIRKNQLTAVPTDMCPTYRQSIFVKELGAPRNICVHGDERLKIGTYYDGTDATTVQFPYTNEMHVLDDGCIGMCRYSSDTDTFISQQRVSQFGLGLVIFKHASSRIHRMVDSNSTVRYVFDRSHPDFELKNDAGRYVLTQSSGMSNSGGWVAVELYDKGLAVVNTETFEVRQITTEGYVYGRGMDPYEELAISDDGKSVILAGRNVGLHAYDVVDGCGQVLIGDLSRLASTSLCPSTDLGVGVQFPNFSAANRPRLYGKGYQLEVVISSWGGEVQRVTYVTKGTTPTHQLKILSIGDSFSSGEGEVSDTFYMPGTNSLYDTCHVSTRAYSSLIARRLGVGDADAKNISCSGAKVGDLYGSREQYWGQGGRLGESGLKLSRITKAGALEEAVNNYQPGRAHQFDFIERYHPEILTIGVGGNDAGLMGKLQTCAMPGTCEWAEGMGIKQTADEIGRLYPILQASFSHIASQVEGTRVFVVGYPNIITPDGQCDPVTTFLINRTERVFIQNSIHYLNQVIRAAANAAKFTYVDIEDSLSGRALCNGSATTAMNGLRAGGDISITHPIPMLKIIGSETFHPTPSGHALIAEQILSRFPGMIDTNPNNGSVEIERPYYWNVESIADSDVRTAYGTDFAFYEDASHNNLSISLPTGTLQEKSVLTVEIHSQTTKLATLIADAQGGFHGKVSVPDSLEEGFHTLHILAINRSGDEVDMYQFITINKSSDLIVSVPGTIRPEHEVNGFEGSELIALSALSGGEQAGSANVLGIQSEKEDIDTRFKEVVTPITTYIKEVSGSKWVLLFAICVAVSSFFATLCAVIVSKRWAKSRT